ncbi:DUF397 domain-containing protein [Streptomyces sp. NPDC007100]|uniref:DUF397 domain-containing protein n=1 Tax=Streptomyces sp. NPDC007100 TaxID=3155602 RepID=UPI0033D24C30
MNDDVWFKSSYSDSAGGECVEIATCPHTIHVRDSKDPQGPRLVFGGAAWGAFLSYASACADLPPWLKGER